MSSGNREGNSIPGWVAGKATKQTHGVRRRASCSGRMPASPNRTPSCSWTPRGSSETAPRAEQETQQSRKKSVGVGAPRTTDDKIFGHPQRDPLRGNQSVNLLVVEIFPPLSLPTGGGVGAPAGGLRDLNMDGACGGERRNRVSNPCWP